MTGAEADRYKVRADELKDRFWGHTHITFHEPKMRRHLGDFRFGGDATRQQEFDEAVTQLVDATEFTAFGAGLRKSALAEFMTTTPDEYLPSDLYAVAVHMLLERYVDYRAMTHGGERTLSKVIFEAQGPVEDATHQREYADLLLNGTQWVADSAFQQWLEPGLAFTPKQDSDPMELADMLSRDIYEWVEAGCTTWPGRWRQFSGRMYCRDDGSRGRFGVKIFPDSDVREAVLAHRAHVQSGKK
jgi:hypothetical protein